MSSMSPHSSLWPGQKPFPFLCQLLELLSCPFLCVIPAVAVLADSHQVGAAPQGEMNIPIINREASRNKYPNPEKCLPLPARFHFTARACLWGVKGINGSHKIFQVACHHLSCALCKWNKVPGTCLPLYHCADWWKSHPNKHLELLKNVSMWGWRIFHIF